MQKRAIVTVINDLTTDQRVARICRTLEEEGYEVFLLGRCLKQSPPLPERPYRIHRMKLPFEAGPLFYASYSFAELFRLLREKADLIWANDLDTLAAAFLASRWKGIPLIYDSHEYFTEVPELQGKGFKKGVWQWIERKILPKLPFMLTVNPSIGGKYQERYGIPVHVLPNHPSGDQLPNAAAGTREELGLPKDRSILILQGSGINVGRGGEELVEAMKQLDNNYLLLFIGRGDVIEKLQARTMEARLEDRIRFLDPMPYEAMMAYTKNADLGLTLDKPVSENYRLSSPNKLFDYIHAGIPVLASEGLPEVERIVKGYDIGALTDPRDPERIAVDIKELLDDPEHIRKFRDNCQQVAPELTWEASGRPVIQKVLKKLGT